jgi:hypothetical protein
MKTQTGIGGRALFFLTWPQGGSGWSMPRLGRFNPAKYTWHPL